MGTSFAQTNERQRYAQTNDRYIARLAQTNMFGDKTAIKCKDGSIRVCNAGT